MKYRKLVLQWRKQGKCPEQGCRKTPRCPPRALLPELCPSGPCMSDNATRSFSQRVHWGGCLVGLRAARKDSWMIDGLRVTSWLCRKVSHLTRPNYGQFNITPLCWHWINMKSRSYVVGWGYEKDTHVYCWQEEKRNEYLSLHCEKSVDHP